MKNLALTKGMLSLGLVLTMLVCTLLLAACGESVQAADTGNNIPAQAAAAGDNSNMTLDAVSFRSPRVTPDRTVSRTPVSQADATAALQTWASEILGVNISLSEAKGMTAAVLANYDIPTPQKGVIEANINASRAAYAGKVQSAGYTTLILGGGSTLSNQDLSVKINDASLGYLQLPAASYPTSSDAALSQLKTAFPALSGDSFTLTASPHNNQNAYIFYTTINAKSRGTVTETGITMGVVQFNGKVWVYALVGIGSFAPQAK